MRHVGLDPASIEEVWRELDPESITAPAAGALALLESARTPS
jgi:hypothetical protein